MNSSLEESTLEKKLFLSPDGLIAEPNKVRPIAQVGRVPFWQLPSSVPFKLVVLSMLLHL